jgi:transposase
MKRFIEGVDRDQGTLFPERLDDFIAEDNPVRVVEAFVEGLDLGLLGFAGVDDDCVASLAGALLGARFWNLPLNVQLPSSADIEVSVLRTRKFVSSRPGYRSEATAEDLSELQTLVETLSMFPAPCR